MRWRRLLELIKRVLGWALSIVDVLSRVKESKWKTISALMPPKYITKRRFAIWAIFIVFLYNITFLFFAKERPSRPWVFTIFTLIVYLSAVGLVVYNGLRHRQSVNHG